jgi:hypothetical protein
MVDIIKCKDVAKSLAKQSKEKLGHQKVNNFSVDLNKIVIEYNSKYMFSSNAIELQKLESCNRFISSIVEDKILLTPIIVDKMVNDKDLYALSIYQNLYAGTDLIPNIDEYKSEYYKNGGGENSLALITGCHWIEQSDIE